MTERDILIEGKVKSLASKQEQLEKSIDSLDDYKTSLRIGSTNLREATSKNEVFEAFKDVTEEYENMKQFEEEFGELEDKRIYGYEYEDWKHDVKIICKRLDLSSQLKKVNESINKLDGFVSAEHKETLAFNALLDDIENL